MPPFQESGDSGTPASRDAGQPSSAWNDASIGPSHHSVDEVFLSSHWHDDRPDRLKGNEPVRRRVWLPIGLFLLTMASTFVAGATGWMPHALIFNSDPVPLRKAILLHWDVGLIYMASLLLLLFAHEMGHFLATLYYRIPASFPYFLPLPVTPIGTLGAVIRMDNRDADRKQMFDIGIAGPLAGLVIAVPLLIIGVQRLDFTQAAAHAGEFRLGVPLGLRMLLNQIGPQGYVDQKDIPFSLLNPYLMAGWVGLLVTGLNMLPVSQLDGGHVTYTLFGKPAHWIARGFMVLVIAYMVYMGTYQMILMLGIILLIGIDHPPTSNDAAPIGWPRYLLGFASLAIPFLFLTVEPLIAPGG
jgi:Zn-dependent protease